MTQEEIMAMPIENVRESESVDGNSIFILFDLNGMTCFIDTYWVIDNVNGISNIAYDGRKLCPYCKQEESYCLKLEAHMNTLFERVIQSKSIRLN